MTLFIVFNFIQSVQSVCWPSDATHHSLPLSSATAPLLSLFFSLASTNTGLLSLVCAWISLHSHHRPFSFLCSIHRPVSPPHKASRRVVLLQGLTLSGVWFADSTTTPLPAPLPTSFPQPPTAPRSPAGAAPGRVGRRVVTAPNTMPEPYPSFRKRSPRRRDSPPRGPSSDRPWRDRSRGRERDNCEGAASSSRTHRSRSPLPRRTTFPQTVKNTAPPSADKEATDLVSPSTTRRGSSQDYGEIIYLPFRFRDSFLHVRSSPISHSTLKRTFHREWRRDRKRQRQPCL
jgi:hypothetical protein